MIVKYKSGEDLRDALPNLPIGSVLLYHNKMHRVIDAGTQGLRAAAIKDIPSISEIKEYNKTHPMVLINGKWYAWEELDESFSLWVSEKHGKEYEFSLTDIEEIKK